MQRKKVTGIGIVVVVVRSSSRRRRRRRRRSSSKIAKSKYTSNIEKTLITSIVTASLVQKSNNFGVAGNDKW